MILHQLIYIIYPFILLITLIHALDITINDVKIDDPAQVVKSKFKKYLPELQETLEIPIRPNQQTIRESFIRPRITNTKGGRINHRGIKSLFRKTKTQSSSISVLSSSIQTSRATNGDFNDTDDEDDISLTQVDPLFNTSDTSTVHSRPSWIKSFLSYKTKQSTVHSMSVDPSSKSNNHKSSPNKHVDSKLKSKITEYEDSLSNPKDLKRWVQLIADKPTATRNNNHGGSPTFPSSSIKTKTFTTGNKNDQQQLEIDIDEFINYLINEQGFNRDDLQFLRMKNLDYGLGEIEQELNKLKDQQGKPKVIKIGGEEDHSNGGKKVKVYWLSLMYFSILLLS
ncbi:Pga46 protein [Candida orthopsilosis Co 90-125]|uniref:Pga46 protein n=1 Tax=Candida orthopsilosis (strain 90-125) TaxID=1136231 RepID=H8X455_CANO9|nr:Pga46 protein [Candida orthopsilosis Co 90-125]CCG26007.1 Pga46 protein [Candida orthopsilosis Co 90-125]